jgi:hypothetical protein
MKKILITGLLCFVVIISKAQNESKDSSIDMGSKKNHYIGFNAGASTGLGLAYRYQNNKHSYQLALLPIMSERNAFVNIGGRYAYNFRQDEKTSFFGYIGHATTYVSRKDYNYINELEYTRTDLSLITGAGFGTEINLNKVLALNFALGIAHYFQSEPYNVVTLTGEIGLFYKLN